MFTSLMNPVSMLCYFVRSADAAKEGIDAFYRLKAHWETQDFDVIHHP